MIRLPVLLNCNKSKRLVSIRAYCDRAYCYKASQTHLFTLLLNVQMNSHVIVPLHAG